MPEPHDPPVSGRGSPRSQGGGIRSRPADKGQRPRQRWRETRSTGNRSTQRKLPPPKRTRSLPKHRGWNGNPPWPSGTGQRETASPKRTPRERGQQGRRGPSTQAVVPEENKSRGKGRETPPWQGLRSQGTPISSSFSTTPTPPKPRFRSPTAGGTPRRPRPPPGWGAPTKEFRYSGRGARSACRPGRGRRSRPPQGTRRRFPPSG